jgi:hypothetical protein
MKKSLKLVIAVVFSSCGKSAVNTFVYEDSNCIYSREIIDFSLCDNVEYETGILELPVFRGVMPSVTV